jgi:hypothetical protein
MRIIGCDLHARQQTLAMLDTETGEVVSPLPFFRLSDPVPVILFIETTPRMPDQRKYRRP